MCTCSTSVDRSYRHPFLPDLGLHVVCIIGRILISSLCVFVMGTREGEMRKAKAVGAAAIAAAEAEKKEPLLEELD